MPDLVKTLAIPALLVAAAVLFAHELRKGDTMKWLTLPLVLFALLFLSATADAQCPCGNGCQCAAGGPCTCGAFCDCPNCPARVVVVNGQVFHITRPPVIVGPPLTPSVVVNTPVLAPFAYPAVPTAPRNVFPDCPDGKCRKR